MFTFIVQGAHSEDGLRHKEWQTAYEALQEARREYALGGPMVFARRHVDVVCLADQALPGCVVPLSFGGFGPGKEELHHILGLAELTEVFRSGQVVARAVGQFHVAAVGGSLLLVEELHQVVGAG